MSNPPLLERRYQFSRKSRLVNAKEYSSLFSKSRRINSQQVAFLVKPNELGIARLGLAISKGHVRKAVDRNRVKRVARESFRLRQALLTGIDIVVVVYKGVNALSKADLQTCLSQLWEKLLKDYKRESYC